MQILKGPVYGGGTGRRAAFDDRRPAFGKTGTQEDNSNAWFVGGTRQLSTAVWVGDPKAYTPMQRVAGLTDYGPNVQGGHYPAVIWKAFMEPAHVGVPVLDWDRPPPPERPNARLVLPGNECILVFAPVVAVPVDPNAPPTTVAPDATTTTTLPPIAEVIEVGTTIPADLLDPNAPLPSVPLTDNVGPCR